MSSNEDDYIPLEDLSDEDENLIRCSLCESKIPEIESKKCYECKQIVCDECVVDECDSCHENHLICFNCSAGHPNLTFYHCEHCGNAFCNFYNDKEKSCARNSNILTEWNESCVKCVPIESLPERFYPCKRCHNTFQLCELISFECCPKLRFCQKCFDRTCAGCQVKVYGCKKHHKGFDTIYHIKGLVFCQSCVPCQCCFRHGKDLRVSNISHTQKCVDCIKKCGRKKRSHCRLDHYYMERSILFKGKGD